LLRKKVSGNISATSAMCKNAAPKWTIAQRAKLCSIWSPWSAAQQVRVGRQQQLYWGQSFKHVPLHRPMLWSTFLDHGLPCLTNFDHF
jgi:hypothetical protein